jgi:glycogen synthase
VFVFASKSETQGMVLTEAMAAGVPVVALDAPGSREVVLDYRNGRLLCSETVEEFSSALQWVVSLPSEKILQLKQAAENTAKDFSMERWANKALALYDNIRGSEFVHKNGEYDAWTSTLRKVKTEWNVLKVVVGAAGAALNVRYPEGEKK